MSSSQRKKPNKPVFFSSFWFFVFGLLLPAQLGKHFWPNFAFVNGIRVDYWSPTLYLTDILLLAGFLTTFNKIRLRKLPKLSRFIPTLVLILVLFLFYFLRAPIKGLFFYRLWQYLKIALAALIFCFATANEKRHFLNGLVGAGLYSLLLSLLQIWQQGSLQEFWWFLGERAFNINSPGISSVSIFGQKILRPYATFSHPNSLAGFFLVVFFLFKLYRLTFLSIIPAALVVVSLSKITIVTMITLLFFQDFYQQKCRLCRVAKLMLGMWFVYFSLLFKGSTNSLTERVASWSVSIVALIKNPLGATPGHYLQNFPLSTPQPVHNIFLLLLTEYGILLPAVFWLFYRELNKMFVHKQILPFICILITGFFDHYSLTLQQNMLLLGVVLGIILNPSAKLKTLR